jgi:hypothetical protein
LVAWSKNEGRNFWSDSRAQKALTMEDGPTTSIKTTFKTGNLNSIKITEGLTTE